MRWLILSILFALTLMGVAALVPVEDERVRELEGRLPEALFSSPSLIAEGRADPSILERLVEVFDAAVPGSAIHASIFLFDSEELIDAMIAANDRGVRVNVMLDWGEPDVRDTNGAAAERLEDRVSKFYRIENDLRASAANHNKFAVFSRIATDGGFTEHVVAQTSSNFHEASTRKLQDLVLFEDEAIHAGYVEYWKEVERLGAFCGELDRYEYRSVSGEWSKAYFFPKRRGGKPQADDSIVSILKNISKAEGCSIRIAMSLWTEGRKAILDELIELAEDGASVEVVLGRKDPNEEMADRLEKLRSHDRTRVHFLETNLHSKYLLIDGKYDGDRRQLIWTGSPNFTVSALHYNLEALVRLEDDDLFDAYLLNFEELLDLP